MILEDGKVTTSSGTNSNWAGPGTLSGTTGGTFDIASSQAFIFNGNIGGPPPASNSSSPAQAP